MFKPISEIIGNTFPLFSKRNTKNLPHCKTLNNNFEQRNANGLMLKFVPQDAGMDFPELGYEERIYQHGLIATRPNNWHDYFNALMWLKFPQTKVAINAIHQHEIKQQASSLRSPKRDLLTLFDECGIIIIASEKIHNLIQQHQWQRLFVEHKEQWQNGKIKPITFGHAMYEKYLNPYIGMTAKALVISLDVVDCVDNIDKYIADNIRNQHILLQRTELLPLPVLGIPKWYKQQTPEFYGNKKYFR